MRVRLHYRTRTRRRDTAFEISKNRLKQKKVADQKARIIRELGEERMF